MQCHIALPPFCMSASVAQYPQPAALTALLRSVSHCFDDATLSCGACPPTWRAITAPVILFFTKFAIVTAHRRMRAADQSQLVPLTAKLQTTQFRYWGQVEKNCGKSGRRRESGISTQRVFKPSNAAW